MKNYYDFPQYEGYYLEDSYVLCVWSSSTIVEFTLLVVLTPKHEDYKEPGPDEQHCYRHARLRFSDCSKIVWTEKRADPAIDANNDVDFGNIDSFQIEGSQCEVYGAWGEIEIESPKVELYLID